MYENEETVQKSNPYLLLLRPVHLYKNISALGTVQ